MLIYLIKNVCMRLGQRSLAYHGENEDHCDCAIHLPVSFLF